MVKMIIPHSIRIGFIVGATGVSFFYATPFISLAIGWSVFVLIYKREILTTLCAGIFGLLVYGVVRPVAFQSTTAIGIWVDMATVGLMLVGAAFAAFVLGYIYRELKVVGQLYQQSDARSWSTFFLYTTIIYRRMYGRLRQMAIDRLIRLREFHESLHSEYEKSRGFFDFLKKQKKKYSIVAPSIVIVMFCLVLSTIWLSAHIIFFVVGLCAALCAALFENDKVPAFGAVAIALFSAVVRILGFEVLANRLIEVLFFFVLFSIILIGDFWGEFVEASGKNSQANTGRDVDNRFYNHS